MSERVDHASQQSVADGNLGNASGALDLVAFADRLRFAEQRRTDVIFFEIQHDPQDRMRKFEQLAGCGVLQSVDARDAVAAG